MRRAGGTNFFVVITALARTDISYTATNSAATMVKGAVKQAATRRRSKRVAKMTKKVAKRGKGLAEKAANAVTGIGTFFQKAKPGAKKSKKRAAGSVRYAERFPSAPAPRAQRRVAVCIHHFRLRRLPTPSAPSSATSSGGAARRGF